MLRKRLCSRSSSPARLGTLDKSLALSTSNLKIFCVLYRNYGHFLILGILGLHIKPYVLCDMCFFSMTNSNGSTLIRVCSDPYLISIICLLVFLIYISIRLGYYISMYYLYLLTLSKQKHLAAATLYAVPQI